MRVRGTGRGLRTLSRFALIGVIGGGAAACSSDSSRLGDPFGNPFASNVSSEPSATGSLPDGEIAPAPVVRTSRIQSQALGAPGAAMSPRPMAAAPVPARPQTSRLASAEPVSGGMSSGGMASSAAVSGMNPDAGRMTTRAVPPAPAPKVVDRAAEKRAAEARREAEAREAAEAKREAEAAKLAEARKLVEAANARKAAEAARHAEAKAAEKTASAAKLAEVKKLVEARKAAEAKAAAAETKAAETKAAEARKAHVRPGQAVAKAEDKPVRKIEIKEAKAEVKPDAKVDTAKADAAKKAEAARKAAEAEAKLAKAEAAKDAARKVAEAKAAADAKAAEAAAKAPVKVASAEPAKVEPASTGSVAVDQSFRWPAKGRVISGYGSSGNEGINISVPEGTPVKAAEDGTVAYAGSDVKGYGKLVLVRHTNGYVSAYAHNGELDVRPGEKVKRGQTIAKSGASGNVTSPQLHFEIRKGATPVDPMPHLASN
ncbi:peptidoglycan DD-metalloendopeptidase family protein [Methylobacterium sp.]|uniref:murein hydrolase activator EnvC family protein n=1 Tax=Methylobacterium sp. TaxID=409 RepID=UPI0025D35CF2|nr:peptidoglycan DD-metalloendopeptidase family protein [Methylobacterium sp.]MBY0259072.1 peptidoglycan DD-metalloendopeptidase family protein [Methylobacterium sp.]